MRRCDLFPELELTLRRDEGEDYVPEVVPHELQTRKRARGSTPTTIVSSAICSCDGKGWCVTLRDRHCEMVVCPVCQQWDWIERQVFCAARTAAAAMEPADSTLRVGKKLWRLKGQDCPSILEMRLRPSDRIELCHFGFCRHVLRVVEVARPSAFIAPELPILRHRHLPTGRVYACDICLQREAYWVVSNDGVTPYGPSGQCAECYIRLHYTAEGTLLHAPQVLRRLRKFPDGGGGPSVQDA